MAGNNLAVKITADVVDLQANLAVARAEVANLTSEMNKLAKASAAGALDPGGVVKLQDYARRVVEGRQATAQLATELKSLQSTSSGVGGAIENVSDKINAAFKFTGIAIGIEAIRRLSAEIIDLGGRAAEIKSLSTVLGTTAEQFQAMEIATDRANVSQQALIRLSERMVAMFTQARDGSGAAIEKLKELGFTNAQIADRTFPVIDALRQLHDRLNDSATAAATHDHIISEFGIRSAQAVAVLKDFGFTEEQIADLMRSVNGLTTQQTNDAAKLYAQVKEFGTYLQNTFTKAMVTATASWEPFAKKAREVMELLKAPVAPALQSQIQVPSIAPQVKADADASKATMAELTVSAKTFTKDELDSIHDAVEAEKSGSAQRVAAARQYYEAAKNFYLNKDDVDKVRQAYKELQAAQVAYAAEALRSGDEAIRRTLQSAEITKRVVAEELADDKKFLDQRLAIENSAFEADTKIRRAEFEQQRANLDEELAARKISAAQWLVSARQLASQLAELDIEELQRKKAMYADEPLEAAKAADEIRVVRAKLNADLAKLDQQAAADARKEAQQQANEWKKAVDEIEGVETTLIGNIISGRKNLGQTMLQISAQLLTQEIANDTKAFTTKLLLGNQEKALEQAGYLYHLLVGQQKVSADSAAAAASRAEQATVGPAQVMADAAVGAAGAMASVAALPGVGWAMAPEVGAAMYSEIAGFAGLASLDVGAWNVPRDMVAQIHRGETIMPAPFASQFREAATGGGAFTGGETHIHITSPNSDSFRSWLNSAAGRHEVVSAISAAHRRGLRRL